MGDTGSSKKSIKEIFDTMGYGFDLENVSQATEWLKNKQNRIFAYLDRNDEPKGESLPLKDANDEHLCDVYTPEAATVDAILKNLTCSKNLWLEVAPTKRAEIIYKFGTEIQKKQELFIQLEIAARGILRKDTKNKALSLLTDYLQYYSGFSVKYNLENPSFNPEGLIVGVLSDRNSLDVFGCLLGPCLASGCRIVLQTSSRLSLIATLLIELAIQAGVPEDTIRLIPGDVDPNIFFAHNEVSTICVFDDFFKEKYILANHLSKNVLNFNSSGSSMIVFDNCDLDSACYSVVDAAFSYQGMLPSSVRNVFVQENIFDDFIHKLKQELSRAKVGKSFEKNIDISYPQETVLKEIDKIVQKAKSEGVEIFQAKNDCAIPTVFIGSNSFPNNVIKQEIINVPVVTVVAFRTINEAVNLSNNSRQGFGASVWSESTSLVNEIIGKLKVGNVWVNCHGLFAADVAFSPFKSSGNAFFGGSEGFYEYVQTKSLKNESISQLKNGEVMEKAINEAKKVQDSWSKLSHFERIKNLQTAAQNIEVNKTNLGLSEKWLHQWITLIYECVSSNSSNFVKFKNFNVATIREPCGIVAVETTESKDDYNKRLIIDALSQGNAVIILNDCEEAAVFYSHVSNLLPKGVLTIISHSQEAIKVAALHKELNVYVGEKTNKVFSSLPLKASTKFKTVDNPRDVLNKITLVKNVWFNKGQSFI